MNVSLLTLTILACDPGLKAIPVPGDASVNQVVCAGIDDLTSSTCLEGGLYRAEVTADTAPAALEFTFAPVTVESGASAVGAGTFDLTDGPGTHWGTLPGQRGIWAPSVTSTSEAVVEVTDSLAEVEVLSVSSSIERGAPDVIVIGEAIEFDVTCDISARTLEDALVSLGSLPGSVDPPDGVFEPSGDANWVAVLGGSHLVQVACEATQTDADGEAHVVVDDIHEMEVVTTSRPVPGCSAPKAVSKGSSELFVTCTPEDDEAQPLELTLVAPDGSRQVATTWTGAEVTFDMGSWLSATQANTSGVFQSLIQDYYGVVGVESFAVEVQPLVVAGPFVVPQTYEAGFSVHEAVAFPFEIRLTDATPTTTGDGTYAFASGPNHSFELTRSGDALVANWTASIEGVLQAGRLTIPIGAGVELMARADVHGACIAVDATAICDERPWAFEDLTLEVLGQVPSGRFASIAVSSGAVNSDLPPTSQPCTSDATWVYCTEFSDLEPGIVLDQGRVISDPIGVGQAVVRDTCTVE